LVWRFAAAAGVLALGGCAGAEQKLGRVEGGVMSDGVLAVDGEQLTVENVVANVLLMARFVDAGGGRMMEVRRVREGDRLTVERKIFAVEDQRTGAKPALAPVATTKVVLVLGPGSASMVQLTDEGGRSMRFEPPIPVFVEAFGEFSGTSQAWIGDAGSSSDAQWRLVRDAAQPAIVRTSLETTSGPAKIRIVAESVYAPGVGLTGEERQVVVRAFGVRVKNETQSWKLEPTSR
jgi:hypothetical protein